MVKGDGKTVGEEILAQSCGFSHSCSDWASISSPTVLRSPEKSLIAKLLQVSKSQKKNFFSELCLVQW